MASEHKEQLARSIALALTTGLFSIVPVVVEGAPVVDQVVTSGTSVEQSGKVTDVTSTVQNNIVNWKDFSVAKDETVRFDQGAQTNNYLNVVTGAKQSEIAGTVEGGKNVYLVNPHGVLVDKGATVNVGNLYVSTTTDTLDTKDYLATGASPLVNTASTAAADVTNMGTIQASNVVVQGKNITFTNRYDVQADSVEFQATGEAALGARVSQQAAAASPAGLRRAPSANGSSSGTTYSSTNGDITLFNALSDAEDIEALSKVTDLSGNYRLTNDIDLENQSYTPIGTDADNAFSGTFDGQFHTISNINVEATYGGLFGYTKGATISNVGVKNGTVKAGYAGGIVGVAEENTKLTNVFNDGVTVQYSDNGKQFAVGGIVGKSSSSIINTAYNTGEVSKRGGGIVGWSEKDKISYVYNTGTGNSGALIGRSISGSGASLNYAYTTGTAIGEYAKGVNSDKKDVNNVVISLEGTSEKDQKKKATYSKLTGISAEGGLSVDKSPWRIYEGQSRPLLRVFLQAKGTVKVDYSYQMGDSSFTYRNTGSNNGADASATYNNRAVKLTAGPTFTDNSTGSTIAVEYASDNSKTIKMNTDVREVVSDSSVTDSDPLKNGVGTTALFYTGQDGYDLVGNNFTVTRREVNISADNLPTTTLEKTYDGTSAVNETDLKSWISGNSKTSGIIPNDNSITVDNSSLSGTYYLNDAETKNAGAKLDIKLSGGLKVTQTGDNYYIKSNEANYDNTIVSGVGQINKATLTVKVNDSIGSIDREYNGQADHKVAGDTTDASGNVTTKGYRLTQANAKERSPYLFNLTGVVSTSTTDSDGKTTTTTDDVYISTTSTDGTGVYGDIENGTFTETGDVGTHSVQYGGIKLAGNDAANYTLVDASGNTIYDVRTQNGTAVADDATGVGSNTNTDGGTFYLSGKITPKTLSSSGFTLPGAASTKTYDGTAYIDANGNTGVEITDYTGKIDGDDVHFTITADTDGHVAKLTQTDGSDAVDANDNTGDAGYNVTYNITVSGDAAKNYKLDNGTDVLSNGATAEVSDTSGVGKIKKRILTMDLGSKKTDIDKTYDGSDDVYVTRTKTDGTTETTKALALSDNLVAYAKDSNELVSSDAADTSKVAFNIEGHYASPNVAVDSNGDATDQAITYTVSLTGTKAKNYAFGTYENQQTSQTVSGATGTINKKTINITDVTDVSKTFDDSEKAGTTTTDTLTAKDFTINGLVGSDTSETVLKDAIANINANSRYGDLSGTTFTANKHVKRGTDGSVEQRDVEYTNIVSSSTNYVFDKDTYYDKGTIKPLTIDTLTLVPAQTVKKVYDGTQYVVPSTKYDQNETAPTSAQSYIGTVTTVSNGKTLTLDNSAVKVADTDAYFTKSDGTATANVSEVSGARFLLSLDETGEYSDYTLGETVNNQSLVNGKAVVDVTGSMDKRKITATQNSEAVTKEYDGKTDIGRTGDKAVKLTGLVDEDANANTSTGKFHSKNVAYETGADGKETDTVTTQALDYTITLNGGSTTDAGKLTEGNYDVYDGSGNQLSFDTSGALTGTGTITPVALGLDFGTITKTYNGTKAIDGNAAAYSAAVHADDLKEDDKGTKDTVMLTADQANSSFDAADVGDRKVTYQYTLSGKDARNYKITTDDVAAEPIHVGQVYQTTTSGHKITTLDLTDDNIKINFGTISKTYDGKTDVAYDHSATNADGVTYYDADLTGGDQNQSARTIGSFLNGDITFGGITIGSGQYTLTGAYTDASAGTKDATFTFALNSDLLKNFNFNSVTFFDKDAGTLTKSQSGTITAKHVQVDFTPVTGQTQVYNGGAALWDDTTNAKKDLSATASVVTAGLIQSTDDVGLQVTGNFIDTTKNVNGTKVTTLAKDAGTGKHIQYDVTRTNTNYAFTTGGTTNGTATPTVASDGTSITYKATGDSSGTITPKTITLAVAKDTFVKDYDASAAVEADDLKNTTNITFDGLVSGETLTPDTDALSANYVKTSDGTTPEADVEWDDTAKAATYKGVHVTGIQNALKNATPGSDTVLVSNYTIANDSQLFDKTTQAGKINRRAISLSDITPTWTAYAREYDTTDDISNPNAALALRISSVGNVTLTKPIDIQYEGSAKFTNANGSTHGGSVARGLGIEVTMTGIKEEELHNFDATDLETAFKNGTTYKNYETTAGVSGGGTANGTITPRLLTVVAVEGADFDKTYDGDANVEDYDKKFEIKHEKKDAYGNVVKDADGKVVYDDAIFASDAAKGITAGTYATYYAESTTSKNATKDVRWENGEVAGNPILTVATIWDGQALSTENYTLVLDANDPTKITSNAQVYAHDRTGELLTGKINPKEVNLIDNGTTLTKEYDGTSTVLADQLKNAFTLDTDDLIDGEKDLALDYTQLVGNYVEGTADTAADEQALQDDDGNETYTRKDVHWDNGVKDWGILVTGAQNALNNATSAKNADAKGSNYKLVDTTGTLSSGTYTLGDTSYFQQAAGRGQIKQIALTMGNLKSNWTTDATPVTKTYDGTQTIKSGETALTNDELTKLMNLTVASYTSNGTEKTIATDNPVVTYTLSSGLYDNANAGTTHALNYTVSGITGLTNADGTENHNFTVDSLANTTGTFTSGTNNVITPKVLKVADLAGKTKTYDGTDVYNGTVTFADGYGFVTSDTTGNTAKVNAVAVGSYDGGKYADGVKGAPTSRTITYDVTLDGDSKDNYTFATDGSTQTTLAGQTATDGHITKRTVYVDFDDSVKENGNATKVDKTYGTSYTKTLAADGKEAVVREADPNAIVTAAAVDDATTGEHTGIVAGDTDVSLNTSRVTGTYDDGQVHRAANGDLTTQGVTYANFYLKDNGSGDADNYEVATYGGTQQLTGSGTISPIALKVTVDTSGTPSKEYDGTTALGATEAAVAAAAEAMKSSLSVDETSMVLGEGINDLGLTIATGENGSRYATADANVKDGLAKEGKDVDYVVNWNNENYALTFEAKDATHAMTTPTVTQATDAADGTAAFAITQGTITPRQLAIQSVRDTSKVYDGDTVVKDIDQYANLTFDRLLDQDKTTNAFATATATYYDENNKDTDANAGIAGSTEVDPDKNLRGHKVRYENINIQNANYELNDANYTANGYVLGNGTITRAPLTLASESVEGRFGQTPTFTGTVTGWIGDDGKDFDESTILWNTAPGASVRREQPIYGWYGDGTTPQVPAGTVIPSVAGWYQDARDGYAATDSATAYRNYGSYGLNYRFEQASGTYTSQADGPNTDILNPARRVRPDMEVYNHVTHDDVGTVIRDPKAGIEYEAGGTSLQTDGSASYNGTMTVEGAGEVVNLTQSGTAASADRVDLTNGSANYTLSGAENVPTADVTVADVTEDVASATTTASATAAAGTTSATSATNADDTTVTDDDDDAVKAAAESSDEREAEATVEYADAAPSLFSEAITGTNVAS